MAEAITVAQLEQAPDGRFVRLRGELGVSAFGINQIVLAPGQRNRIHSHEHQEEVYLVLDGVLTLVVEGEEREFRPGVVVRVAPQTRRQLVNRHKHPVSLIALGGNPEHEHSPRDAQAYREWTSDKAGTPQDTPLPDDLPESELRD